MDSPSLCAPPACESAFAMASNSETASIPDERLSIEQRHDGAILVRVKSEGREGVRLPDAVFSFRCGDPQYSYWLARLKAASQGR